MIKTFKIILILAICSFASSCINPSHIELKSVKLVKASMSGLNRAEAILEVDVSNMSRRFYIKEASFNITTSKKKIGQVTISDPVLIDKGESICSAKFDLVFSAIEVLPLVLNGNIQQLISDTKVDGYIKVKVGIFTKKIKLRSVPVSYFLTEERVNKFLLD